MLSLKLVMLALIPVSAAILSISAWYQWSFQLSQLKVPVGPGVAEATAADAAAVGAAEAAAEAAAVAPDAPHAARKAPSPTVAPVGPASLRKSRRWSCLVSSSIPCPFRSWSD